VIWPILLSLLGASAEPLWHPSTASVFSQATSLCAKGSYDEAEAATLKLTGRERDLLQGVVALARFEDLHDPARLTQASQRIESAIAKLSEKTARERFLLALALTQKAVVAGKLGSNLSAAWSGRKAAQLCQALKDEGHASPDLDGILGGYFFWKAQSLGAARALLGGDTRAQGILMTQSAAASSSPFQEAYRTSLVWMRFEQSRYTEALQICQAALDLNPNNRIWRQARGDMLFRLGRNQEALEAYRASWNEYAGLEVLPVNRQSAAGNLGRIHLALGNSDSARKWIKVFDDPRQTPVRRWLPSSLVKEVAPVRKALSLPEPKD
jgi:tetratricopeptide (TPR) repeat protein